MREVLTFMVGLAPMSIAIFVMALIVWFGVVWATTVFVYRLVRAMRAHDALVVVAGAD